ncbi:MAG: hypothetical protein WBW06_03865 [Xanthobacteraceae bacterium]|jgi:hypothetical protein
MRNSLWFIAFGGAVLTGSSVASAQTVETIVTPAPGPAVIAQAPVAVPPSGVLLVQPAPLVTAAPLETVETVKTVRTTTPVVRHHVTRTRTADRVTTVRTTTVQQIAMPPATAAYDELMRGPPLYDVVAPAAPPLVATQPIVPAVAPVVGGVAPIVAGTALPLYRYVYEPDRILVIDPATNIAIQAIPR